METKEAKRFREIAAYARELASFTASEDAQEHFNQIADEYEKQATESGDLRAMLPPHQRLPLIEIGR